MSKEQDDTTTDADRPNADGDTSAEQRDHDADDGDAASADQADSDEKRADDTTPDDTDHAADAGGSEPATFLGFAADDWLVILLLAGLVAVIAVPVAQYTGVLSTADDVDPGLTQYCEDTAASVQANASLPQGTSCDCVLPGEFDESQFETDVDRVNNATDLFLVQCTMPDEQTLTVPVRRVNPGFNVSDQNESIGGNGTTVLE